MTTITTATPLAEQIDAQVEHLAGVLDVLDAGALYEDADGYVCDPDEQLCESALEVAVVRTLRVVLCTGGPHVELVGELDADNDVVEAHVVGAWGSERINRRVYEGETAWKALAYYAGSVIL